MKPKAAEQEGQDHYQELFNYMSEQHNVLLLETDMFDILDIVKKIIATFDQNISIEKVRFWAHKVIFYNRTSSSFEELNNGLNNLEQALVAISPTPLQPSGTGEEGEKEVREAFVGVQCPSCSLNFAHKINLSQFESPSAGHKDSEDLIQKINYLKEDLKAAYDSRERHLLEKQQAQQTIAQQEQTIEDLKEQLEGSRIVYQDPDNENVKVTEADQAQWWAEEAQHFRNAIAQKNEQIAELQAQVKMWIEECDAKREECIALSELNKQK